MIKNNIGWLVGMGLMFSCIAGGTWGAKQMGWDEAPATPDPATLYAKCDHAAHKGYWTRWQVVAVSKDGRLIYDYVFADWMNETDYGIYCNE